jgi:hypothetical protein
VVAEAIKQDEGMRKLLLVLTCTSLAACSGGGGKAVAGADKPAGGDKAVCGAFQKLADALLAQDAARAKSALAGLKSVAASATSTTLRADASGLGAATDGTAAARFGQKIVQDCKVSGNPLTPPTAAP